MRVRISRRLQARLASWRLSLETIAQAVLDPRLRALVEAPLVHRSGSLVLEPLIHATTGAEAFQDRTGFEAFVNKIHVDDFVDQQATHWEEGSQELVGHAIKAALTLAERLESRGPYRVLLSLDTGSQTVSLRFFERREAEPWGADDPDAFQLEEVLMIDT